jgi:predicted histidine transporter YuiF (NhaC family)
MGQAMLLPVATMLLGVITVLFLRRSAPRVWEPQRAAAEASVAEAAGTAPTRAS